MTNHIHLLATADTNNGITLAGYREELMRFPDEKLSVFILANRGDANPTRKVYEIVKIILKDKIVK